jgi:ribonucleoside-triphosphate reductase
MIHESAQLATVPEQVLKRTGELVSFDAARIESALIRAGRATGEYGEFESSLLTDQVLKVLTHRFSNTRIPNIEYIQDVIEQTLISANYFRTARSYIVYREQRRKLRSDQHNVVDVATSINEYLNRSDWRVAANANQGYSLGGLILNTSGKMIANYWLNHVYPPEIGLAHRKGDLHIHDLDMLAGYCAGWSLRTLLNEGFNGVPGKVEAAPPKHMSSAIGQIVNFLGTLQNEWAGAQAFSSFDTYMAPFVRIDNLTYSQVKQQMQELIYNLNVPSRWGCQCVDAATECLTENGWKRYDQIQPGEKIATFDWRTNQLEYLEPLAITAYDFDGEMYVLRNHTQAQWVTPRHKIVRKIIAADNQWQLDDIEDVIAMSTPVIVPIAWATPSTSEIDDHVVQLLAWLALAGDLTAGQGVQINLWSGSCLDMQTAELDWLLTELGLSWHRYRQTGTDSHTLNGYYELTGESSAYVRSYLPDHDITALMRTLSARQIRLFLDTYRKGVATGIAADAADHYSTNRDHFDALQELCSLAGWGSTIETDHVSGQSVLISHRDQETVMQLIERRRYRGQVWCPTTRNGTFIARRQGATFITGNTPFTNLTFDWVCPDDLRTQKPIIGGVEQAFYYGDLQREMDLINRAYIEVMTEGDAKGRVFTFPIPTYNITDDFPWESDNAQRLFEMTAKFGLPYFQSFLNSELEPGMVRSMCCRLQLDLRELLKRGNGLFGSAEQTGSVGVVTINCARLGYLHQNDEPALLARLDELLDMACVSLELKRKTIKRHLDAGLFPYTKRYLGTLRNHFSTIGVNGINELIRNFSRDHHDITDDYGQALALRLLQHVRAKMVLFQEQTGHLYNLEASPAEGCTYRFAREDQKRYADIIQAGSKEAPYYTNSSQLPVGFTDDPFLALELQDQLQTQYTGGTVLHLYMRDKVSSPQACGALIKRVLENFRLPYLTITPTFSICPKHGYLSGEHEFCPKCDQELLTKKRAAIRQV